MIITIYHSDIFKVPISYQTKVKKTTIKGEIA